MTAQPSIESRLSAIFRDYLAPAFSGPVKTVEEALNLELQRPHLLIRASAYDAQRRRLTLTADLHTLTNGDGATYPAACADAMGRIRARIADRAALYAYLATLPAADRTGWQLLHHAFEQPEMSLDEKGETRIDAQPFTLVLRVREMIGAA